MPDDTALAIGGNALAYGGHAVVGSSNCPCCDVCPTWRRLVRCDDGGSCTPPVDLEIWMCSTVRCTDGRAITPGMVVLIDGFCYRVTDETNENPPNPRLPVTAELRCVDGCSDPVCPTSTLYWPGRFCSGDPRTVWVCGVPPGCHIRGCIIVDGGATPRTYDQIPDDPPLLARFIDLGPSAQNCCDCRTNDPNDPPGEGPCLTTPLLEFDPGPPCHNIGQSTCCCELDFSTGQGVPRTTFRLTNLRTEQQVVRPGFPDLEGTVSITLVDPCSLQFQLVRQGFSLPPGGETESGDPWPLLPSSWGCSPRCPGNWPAYAPRVLGVNGSQRLVGLPGITWGNDCLSYQNEDGTTTETLSFTNVYTCNLFRQLASYRYTDPQNGITILTRFEFEGVVTGQNNCLANCDSIVNGGNPTDGGSVDAPPAGGAGGGIGSPCAGCGAGQARTRL